MLHIARVALRVSDLERSVRFYIQVAGLESRERGGRRAMLAAPGGGPVVLELRRAERSGVAPRNATGLFHTALRYPTRAALAVALRRTIAARHALTGASDHGVSEALYLDDPDGLGVELYRDRPRDRWPAPRTGERVRMVTLPLDLESVLSAADAERADGERTGDAQPGGEWSVDVGHVHLKVSSIEEAVAFWTRAIGMELTTRIGAEAAFLATGGYHHHIGVNTWWSRGAAPEPPAGPGLDGIAIGVAGDPAGLERARERLRGAGAPVAERGGGLETRTPDGVCVRLEAA
ncbi:MAG TPA: VOC family protein [Gemmatimonadota bacterium]|nr:VOC family protein [Gemmatimonadota bacterium]